MTTALIAALSLEARAEQYGAYAGIAAVFGLGVLSLLYFAQAREVKRLREWAGRAPERAAEIEARVTAEADERRAGAPEPAAEPAVAAAATALAGNGSRPAAPAVVQPLAGVPASAPGAPVRTAGVPASVPAVATAAATAAGARAAAAMAMPAGPSAGVPMSFAGAPPRAAPRPAAPPAPAPALASAPTTTAEPPAAPARTNGVGAGPPSARPPEPAPAPSADRPDAEPEPAFAPSADRPDAEPEPAFAPSADRPDAEPAAAPSTDHPDAEPAPDRRPPEAAPVPARVSAGGAKPPRQIRTAAAPARAASASATVPPRTIPPRTAAALRARPTSGRGGGRSRRTLVVAGGAMAAMVAIVVVLGITLTGGDANEPAPAPNTVAPPPASSAPAGDGQPSAAAPERVNRSEVTVAVLNGTTVTGLARGASDKLSKAGFRPGVVTNDTTNQARSATAVLYAQGNRSAALDVARVINVGRDAVQPIDQGTRLLAGEDADVVVSVGADQSQ